MVIKIREIRPKKRRPTVGRIYRKGRPKFW